MLTLANLGMETVHRVHVDDVAQAFVRALDNMCHLADAPRPPPGYGACVA